VKVTVFDAPGSSLSRANPISCCGQRHAGDMSAAYSEADVPYQFLAT
jgi:hypothetical protein